MPDLTGAILPDEPETVISSSPAGHQIKVWPGMFRQFILGAPVEITTVDHGWVVADWVLLREWDPDARQFTDRVERRQVGSVRLVQCWGRLLVNVVLAARDA